ncbi:MAG TPA: hypothetical protein VM118_14710 [Acidobacteriota bacterium]|nr:hypothetical protein [Acidobacteriota bacterium]
MRCFFWGTNNLPDRDVRGAGITSFAIPDWGVQFRAAQFGTATECEYGALLALLAFIEKNPKVFEGVKLELYSDAAAVIYQVNRRNPVPPAEARFWALVRRFRVKRPFELCWVPRDQNRAHEGILGVAPLKLDGDLKFPAIEPARSPLRPPQGDLLL